MTRALVAAALTATLTLLTAGAAAAQDADTWTWSGTLQAGKSLEIKNINGRVEARTGSGNTIEVRARKHGKDDPALVTVEVVEHGDGITICAVYPDVRGKRPNECRPGRDGRMNTRDTEVAVDFEVEVPAGLTFIGKSVNGDVTGRGLQGTVIASTVNGEVDVETTGWAEATSVNGDVAARLGRADWTGTLEFTTVNGRVSLWLPDGLNTEVEASTVNGDFTTDFPLAVRGRFGRTRVEGTIGTGGRRLEITTVNGAIRILKR